MRNSVYNASNVNAGKFAGSEPRSLVDAGVYSHSGGASVVPVMDFEEKLPLYFVSLPVLCGYDTGQSYLR